MKTQTQPGSARDAAHDKRSVDVTRRDWMRKLGFAAGAFGLAEAALADYGTGNVKYKLLRRITYGPTEADVLEITTKGYAGYLAKQLAYATIRDNIFEGDVKTRYPRTAMSIGRLATLEDDWITQEQIKEATIYRALKSKRQLYTKMVEFWSDHFNVYIEKSEGWLFVPYHNAIRKYAMGRFKDLLMAVAKSPAMLVYLDNVANEGDFGNVNFARELMELHTVSVTGGYTPADIRNVQRAFSGWEMSWEGSSKGTFRFDPDKHSTLPKSLMGTPIPGNGLGGVKEGTWVIDFLANHPNTAKFISKKLLRFFLDYEPSDAQINAVAAVFTQTKGDIKACLKIVLSQANMEAAPAKLKRPYNLIMHGMRAMRMDFEVDAWTLKYEFIDRAGQLPFSWVPPNGYPDRVDFWGALLLPRWNFALAAPRQYIWGTTIDIPALLQGATTGDQIAARINKLLFQGEMETTQFNALKAFLNAQTLDDERIQAGFALALASPHFQWQ